MNLKIKPVPIAVQALNLQKMYEGSAISTSRGQELKWTHIISPSPLGDQYKVKLTYRLGKNPQLFVMEPKPLVRPEGKTVLPHCYDTAQQKLCLYYPDGSEWNKSMLLSKTVVLWAYEWLYHYEIWRMNGGIWTGGGVHPLRKMENKNG